MNLERLAIVARPRDHWEALDLGILVARRWYKPLFLSFIAFQIPVFLLAYLLFSESPGWGLLLVWWLKPVYERVPLRFLGDAMFDSAPRLGEALRNAWPAVRPGMLGVLTYRRLAPSRSFEAPVMVLEGMRGARRRERMAVLAKRAGSAGFWLTVIGVHVEMFLSAGVIVGAFQLIPASVELDWWDTLLAWTSAEAGWWFNVLSAAVMAFIGPFYVACGFALYLNRRVELEAWDIEIGFRRMARRLAGATIALAALAVLAQPTGAVAARDEPTEVRRGARAESYELITEVLAGPAFHEEQTRSYPEALERLFDDEEAVDDVDPEWIIEVMKTVAAVAEVVLWIAVIGLVAYLLWKLKILDRLPRRGGKKTAPKADSFTVVFDELPESAHPSRDARARWAAGDVRAALALLLRDALEKLVRGWSCRFADGYTEADCVAEVDRKASAEERRCFGRLVALWQSAAYGHRVPSDESFDALLVAFEAAFPDG